MYTQRLNRKYKRVGHVFQGRFKSIIVDKDAYLLELSRYIVRNPVATKMVNHAGDWPWSSYNATMGAVPGPEFLKVEWLLSQFSSVVAYVDFGCAKSVIYPWQFLNGPDILGDDDFRTQLQGDFTNLPMGIEKRKALLRHLPLSDIAQSGKSRGDWMRDAYCQHGYTMQSIAQYANLHHSTVSRLIKMENDDARKKT